MVRRSVWYDTCAVDADDDGKVVEADVVKDIVQGTLEECGINGNDGAEALAGEPRCEGDGM